MQTNLVKGLVPLVSVIEKLVKARDNIPKDALDVPELIRAATDAIALVGAANFELNMQRRSKRTVKRTVKCDFQQLIGSYHDNDKKKG